MSTASQDPYIQSIELPSSGFDDDEELMELCNEALDVSPGSDETLSLDALASFDFEGVSQGDSSRSKMLDSTSAHTQGNDVSTDESDFDVTLEKPPIYRRPMVRLLSAGGVCLILMSFVGTLFSNASGVKIGVDNQTTKSSRNISEEEEVDPGITELAEAKAELATNQLEEEVNQINANVQKERASKNSATQASTNSNLSNRTTSIPPSPRPQTTPRISFPERRTVPDVRSRLPIPPSRPISTSVANPLPSPSPVRFSEPVKVLETDETLTFLSLGQVENTSSQFPPENRLASVPGDVSLPSENELNQELSAFIGETQVTKITPGSKFSARTNTSLIAVSGSKFMARIENGDLAGGLIIGQVEATSGKIVTASAQKLVFPESEYELSNVTVTGHNGSLLKAKKNKSFFSSGFGKALLGAGRGLANEATSRSQSFTQFENGGFTSSTDGGNRDLQSLAFGALEGFADPLLDTPNPENTPFLKPNTRIEIHFFETLRLYR